ncbi:DUF4244 domain-containing protein [Actinophytocola oryzae]|uniref:Uncharacterized protein DUF4244 n=1 Tax=Actinophytocola oryzae TaxID=502181 RepID=A0A4R7UX53_9PSEU|nr:DUF4244 domain-containing protein [Actinophytocola oryzae]TDV40667.1 uncharacterized protein DUF4244 [Actinophytocola oryzae]
MFPHPKPIFLNNFLEDDAGMVTPEYSLGMVTALSIGLVLFIYARSETFRETLTGLVDRALALAAP